MCFKAVKEKKLTLNSAFIKIFGEYLEPLGFVSIYDYFTDEYPYSGSASISQMYICGDQNGGTRDYYNRVAEFAYEKNNQKSLIAEMMFVLELTKRYILPAFDGVDSYESCIDFSVKYNRRCTIDHWYLKAENYHEILDKWCEERRAANIEEYEITGKVRGKKTLPERLEGIRKKADTKCKFRVVPYGRVADKRLL